MPIKMIRKKSSLIEYYNRKDVVDKYNKKRFNNTFGRLQHETEVEIINSYLVKMNNPIIMEVPVGTGRITRELKISGIGVDTSENMISVARKAAPGWKFIKRDIMKLSFKERFDVVISFRLLRHFDKKIRASALKKVHSMLKPNGLLIFDMPTGRYNKILAFIDKFKSYDKIYEDDTPIDEIKKELQDAGFRPVRIYNAKFESFPFRLICLTNDKINLFYSLLKRRMKNNLNNIKIATNVVIVAKKVNRSNRG